MKEYIGFVPGGIAFLSRTSVIMLAFRISINSFAKTIRSVQDNYYCGVEKMLKNIFHLPTLLLIGDNIVYI